VNHDDAVDDVNRWRERRRKIRRAKSIARKAYRHALGFGRAAVAMVAVWFEEIDDDSHE